MRSFVNEFQRLQKKVPSAPEFYFVEVIGYNNVQLFNNTWSPIAWANEYNYIGSYANKVIYRGNENELNKGVLQVFLPEQVIGQPVPEATIVKKRFL